MRTDSLRNNDNEDLIAQSLLHHQIEYAGMRHPNFHSSMTTVNPDRPLTDIPDPSPRYQQTLSKLLSINSTNATGSDDNATKAENGSDASMWSLIASPELASHLDLLQLGGLINLPTQFFESKTDSRSEVLAPLTEMTLLDMSDIYQVCLKYPTLTRYGFKTNDDDQVSAESTVVEIKDDAKTDSGSSDLSAAMPEMINDLFAPSWEPILYPERFDNGVDSLTTDILACSTAVHVLKQCQTRQSVNRSLTAKQICQHMRSYVLSQCNTHPQFEKQYRQIRLFEGHIVVAASYLGLEIVHADKHSSASTVNNKGETSSNLGQAIYFNISSQSSLFVRYPNISAYYINGWS